MFHQPRGRMQPGNSSAAPVVAIVGATGAVGVELIECLERRKFPMAELRLFASARSAGKKMPFRGQQLSVRELTEELRCFLGERRYGVLAFLRLQ